MADQATSELPRIAFVFGDAALAAHVREAMAGHAEIVYAASQSEFDARQLAGAHVAAALVNVDDGDWLDAIEARLQAAGVRVVFNDPEISQGLDGWERARWLRHLAAKLRGSVDFDPPRPVASALSPAVVATDASASVMLATPAPQSSTVSSEEAVVERPLSAREIETMTADFIAEPELPDAHAPPIDLTAEAPAGGLAGAAGPVPSSEATPDPERPAPMAVESMAPVASAMPEAGPALAPFGEPAPAIAAAVPPPAADADSPGLLDVDTEALSAMIDARLAEPEVHGLQGANETWNMPDTVDLPVGPVEAVDAALPGQPERHRHEGAPAPTTDAPAAAVITAGDADDDVLASLPSLDDWRLIDPDAETTPVAKPAERKASAPVLPDSFAGLELVPMEAVVPIERNTDPTERWLGDSGNKVQADGNKT